jgi:hypothetical protein
VRQLGQDERALDPAADFFFLLLDRRLRVEE